MRDLYPEIEPYAHGLLDVGDGNFVYWETCGNPRGKPAVVFHRGPGSGCSPWFRRLFDPDACSISSAARRSTPHARPPRLDVATNNTAKTDRWYQNAPIVRRLDARRRSRCLVGPRAHSHPSGRPVVQNAQTLTPSADRAYVDGKFRDPG